MTTYPEVISPSVEGYFHVPAIWVGEEPLRSSARKLNPAIHHETVFFGSVSKNLTGLFLFDFTDWDRAPPQKIPRYSIAVGQQVPSEVVVAERKAENCATMRSQLMNVHQACLVTSEYLVFHRSSSAIGIPVDSANTLKSWDIHSNPGYRDDTEDYRALVMNVMNNAYNIEHRETLPRRVLELAVIEKSFVLLDAILNISEVDLISSVDLLYVAAYRYREKRFSESVVLSWSVSEKLINVAWARYLKEREEQQSGSIRMSKRRRTQLTNGRDFTASIMSEILELTDILPFSLYERLGQSRRARNGWAHELRQLTSADAISSITACQDLLTHLFGVQVTLSFGYRGGVPAMPTAAYNELRQQRG